MMVLLSEVSIMGVKNSLKRTNPDIAKEWHPTKNGDLTPEMVTSGSSRIVWWMKPYTDPRTGKHFEFEWQAKIVKRAHGNQGCPHLSGHKVYPGFNDLKSQKPQLALEWNYEKNGSLKPEAVTIGSHKKVWWRCQLGHEWQVSIKDRVQYCTGCPVCSKEMKSSFPEQSLFYYISKYFSDAVNGDMHMGVELDIFIPSKNVALEYDGYHWHKSKSRTANDIKKNKICSDNSVEMVRIRELGLARLSSCIEHYIDDPNSDKSLTDTIISVLRYLGVANPEVDVQKDRAEIMSNYIRHKKKNSLLVRNPEIAKEWHPTKNVVLTPDLVDYGSNKVVWWLGKCGHEWTDSIKHRTGMLTQCPCCRGLRVLPGFNDLKSQNPQLASEWNYGKNGSLKPEAVTTGSGKRVWWKCKNGHEWKAVVASRNKGRGCPHCANDYVWVGYNDLLSKNPKLAAEWHPTKNGDLSPDNIVYGSNKRVWWLGKCGHEWPACISARNRGNGCPYCNKGTLLQGFNDIETTNPKLAAEWHPTRNGDLKPSDVTAGSNQKVWWKCSKGHEWKTTICSRSRNHGCPHCSGRFAIQGETDLATVHPELLAEWNYEKNGSLLPTSVSYGSKKKVWWICKKGHEWQAEVNCRNAGQNCPRCSKEKTSPKVLNIDTGEVFENATEAAKSIGLKDNKPIRVCCNGHSKTVRGYHWKYLSVDT